MITLPVLRLESGQKIFHVTNDPESLLANGFDPKYANQDYFGSFFFASERAVASNCSITLTAPLTLVERGVAQPEFPSPFDSSWLDQDRLGEEGIDGTFQDIEDACTDLGYSYEDGWALELIVFKNSLHKLGTIVLLD